jgi:hypothetical protein
LKVLVIAEKNKNRDSVVTMNFLVPKCVAVFYHAKIIFVKNPVTKASVNLVL